MFAFCDDLDSSYIHTLDLSGAQFEVLCDSTDGGGWLTLLRRKDGSIDFASPTYSNYAVDGVGSLSSEFMLPLDLIHRITSSSAAPIELLVTMRDGTD